MGDYDPSPDQDVDSDYSISVEGPGGQADYEDPHQFNGFGPFHYHDQSASSAPNIPTDVLQPNFDDLRMAGLPHSYPSQFPSPEGPISGGDSLVASLDGLDLDHTIIPPPWTQFPTLAIIISPVYMFLRHSSLLRFLGVQPANIRSWRHTMEHRLFILHLAPTHPT
ncbi:hypothetical protein D9757_005002 [Collybiopsis confluens]|uniref:Uncharacterized protein n=1 Tax=Collybiopsis confluens TaxID=2823264 RepID=A0A8H5HTS6_9AGAR|nr:hypothetical protein D9757_005002 [Collybiopsis confluens]